MTRRALPALLWAALIFLISHRSKLPRPPMEFEGLDKVAHAGVYGILAWLLLYAWPSRPARRGYVLIWTLCCLYALGDEWHQSFVPGRSPDILDIVADAAGALVALALVARHQRFRQPASP